MNRRRVIKFDTYRWNGNGYTLYKKARPHVATGKSIEGIVSPAYVQALPSVVEDPAFAEPVNEPALPAPKSIPTVSTLSPLAALLFANAKTRLTDAEKNDVAARSGITAADTAKTKGANRKRVLPFTLPT